ncbi:hypothetical protein A8F94_12330 [Bacillus sp. FJAT-27225]|uniref:hypothetical protein n=1 Tax=Bacillus sp. FJAT-27225 TaxID=1743144 RepID=UPI00080C235A|nr:hypothetical protein [Bacillus sp. FJAT-27225]OCA85658.1 hypothetical protein A8F94_12330 [Bacillus sp. FJAT-27225]
MKKLNKLEAIVWNIALPGFSQILSGSLIKGILFILLEIIINVNGHFNEAIMHSFMGNIPAAFDTIDYGWLMFYPCLYMFALWDAYRTAMTEDEKGSFLPFVFGAYFVTVGLMISSRVTVADITPGPVFTPMLFLIPGLLIGYVLKRIVYPTINQQ